ncbi:hypothetical protein GCM10027347_58720 [Larkinella harenae]
MALAYENSVPAAYRTEFINKVVAISNRLGINPNWLMIVMRFESANTFLPYVKNPNSGAVGLIQFTQVAIKDWGVTLNQLAAMTAVQQLDYVEKYLTPYKGRMTDLYNVYLAVFAPAYIGRPDAQKVYASPSNAYNANKPLDTNNDGVITVGEIKSVIARYIPAGYDAGSNTLTDSTNTVPLVAMVVVLILIFLFLNRS